jgi:CheY-like chemotaxis protein
MSTTGHEARLFHPAVTDAVIQVLVVDDYPAVADVIYLMLDSVGCDVWLADSAEAALQLLPEHDWDVLVTDLNMPGLSGLELLRLRDRELPAILMGAGEQNGMSLELKFLNAAWLQKPFSEAQLIELVLSAADRRRWKLRG